MTLVVDSSIVLAWSFVDEQTAASRSVLRRVGDEGAVVPDISRFEVANALQMAVRRRRIDSGFRDRVLTHLSTLRILTDAYSQLHAWSAGVRLSERHNLTVYDAAYLELAHADIWSLLHSMPLWCVPPRRNSSR